MDRVHRLTKQSALNGRAVFWAGQDRTRKTAHQGAFTSTRPVLPSQEVSGKMKSFQQPRHWAHTYALSTMFLTQVLPPIDSYWQESSLNVWSTFVSVTDSPTDDAPLGTGTPVDSPET